ncbi:hypothetical protein PSPO01_07409 [Paraphaeosphaeria sporulosa]
MTHWVFTQGWRPIFSIYIQNGQSTPTNSVMVYRLASVAFIPNVSFRREPGSIPGNGKSSFLPQPLHIYVSTPSFWFCQVASGRLLLNYHVQLRSRGVVSIVRTIHADMCSSFVHLMHVITREALVKLYLLFSYLPCVVQTQTHNLHLK